MRYFIYSEIMVEYNIFLEIIFFFFSLFFGSINNCCVLYLCGLEALNFQWKRLIYHVQVICVLFLRVSVISFSIFMYSQARMDQREFCIYCVGDLDLFYFVKAHDSAFAKKKMVWIVLIRRNKKLHSIKYICSCTLLTLMSL